MMKKRAQLMSHPFTVILTLVSAALIIFFGISVLRDLWGVSNEVDLSTFYSNLQKEVNAYYNLDEGSQKTISLSLPKEIAYICFVDQSSIIDYSKIPNNKENLVKAITNKNIFFISQEGQPSPSQSAIQINNLKPSINPLCIKTIGKLSARIISKGIYVEIAQ